MESLLGTIQSYAENHPSIFPKIVLGLLHMHAEFPISNLPFFCSLSSILFMDIIFHKIYRSIAPAFHRTNAVGTTHTHRIYMKRSMNHCFLADLESRSVKKISIIKLMVCNCQLKHTTNKKWTVWLPGFCLGKILFLVSYVFRLPFGHGGLIIPKLLTMIQRKSLPSFFYFFVYFHVFI